ncbi:MAG: methylmalonyl Co-A mutase-associated GTPase MeaB [Opitutaceae bacterium]|nr:methylmalonyl Co-A mutase-associated GTPase MeaB [Opitutaceae bacterium]
MKPAVNRPDWVPPDAGREFTTRVLPAQPAPAAGGGTVKRRTRESAQQLAQAIRQGDRGALARGITLIESRAAAHRREADALLHLLTPQAGGAMRLGITGAPGAGKSTFIDALGVQLCTTGRRVAVLSVDPSSPVTRGSILGDKTRMERLSRQPQAFIRPSPSGGELGGVARRTRESIVLCEAAGFDVVLVETVGVGQSEVLVRGMVDCFLVLLLAGAGDELQGIKKGLLELADVLTVNKADGDNRARAEATRREFSRALHYLAPPAGHWQPPVLACSAVTGDGIAEVWTTVEKFFDHGRNSGEFEQRRQDQAQAWLDALVAEGLREQFEQRSGLAPLTLEITKKVRTGRIPAPEGARRLLIAAGFVHE